MTKPTITTDHDVGPDGAPLVRLNAFVAGVSVMLDLSEHGCAQLERQLADTRRRAVAAAAEVRAARGMPA